MPEASCGLDPPCVHGSCLDGPPQRMQHLTELAVRIALIIGRREVCLVVLACLLVRPFLVCLVGEAEPRERVGGVARDHRAKGLESCCGHRARRLVMTDAICSGASSGVKCRTSGRRSSVAPGMLSWRRRPMAGGRKGSCAPQTIAVGATMSLSRGARAMVSAQS